MEKKILILGSGKVTASMIRASIQSDEEGLIICAGGTDKATIESVLAERGIRHSGLLLVGEAPLQTSELTEGDVANLVAMKTKEVVQRISLEEIDNKINPCYERDNLKFLEKQNSQAGWKNRPKHRR